MSDAAESRDPVRRKTQEIAQKARSEQRVRNVLENHLERPIIPFGSLVECHPLTANHQSRIHQFGKKVLLGLFLVPNYHEDHIAEKGDNSLQQKSLVHKFILLSQAMKIPAAKAAVDKKWEKWRKFRRGT